MAAEDAEKRRQRRGRAAACWCGCIEAELLPRDIMTRAGVRERDRRGDRRGRLDQRRAAPPGHRPRRRGRARRSTTSSACATPCRCSATSSPRGSYVATDLHRVGGIPLVMKMLLDAGLLDGDCLTVTGKTVAENLDRRARHTARRAGRGPAARPAALPARSPRHPARQPGPGRRRRQDHRPASSRRITGPARVFDERGGVPGGDPRRRDPARRRDRDPLRGPRGGPGMREMLSPTSRAHRQGPGRQRRPHHRRALLRRHLRHGGRATSRPRPRSAGRSACSREGDTSPSTRNTTCSRSSSSDEELQARRRAWTTPAPHYTNGVLAKYARLVSSASRGAVTD